MKIINLIKRIKSVPKNQLLIAKENLKSINDKKKVFLSKNKKHFISISQNIISLPHKSLEFAQDKLKKP